jgi:hypothetical protein
MRLWVFAYCSENRIPTTHLTVINTIKVSKLNLEKFRPGVDDINEIRGRLETIVARIIVGIIHSSKISLEI